MRQRDTIGGRTAMSNGLVFELMSIVDYDEANVSFILDGECRSWKDFTSTIRERMGQCCTVCVASAWTNGIQIGLREHKKWYFFLSGHSLHEHRNQWNEKMIK